jgi:hypothetical protein
MRWARVGIVGAAALLAVHVVMLAGVDLGHPHLLVTAITIDHQPADPAPAVARPSRGQSMTVACLAMPAGLLLVHAASSVDGRRRRPRAVMPPAAPVPTPPTPPPITRGVSRS